MFFSGLSIVTFVLAFVVLLFGAKLLVRSGWLFGWLRGMSGVGLVVVAALLSIVALDFRRYQQLSKDKPIATVSFEEVSKQNFVAILIEGEPTESKMFQLAGDQWQIDARILRWSGVFRTLGGKPGYQLDRISGRYRSVVDEINRPRTAYDLTSEESFIDVWQWIYTWKGLVPGVDATYGSATFVPMADGALYQLGLGDSGLVAIPINEAAKNAVYSW